MLVPPHPLQQRSAAAVEPRAVALFVVVAAAADHIDIVVDDDIGDPLVIGGCIRHEGIDPAQRAACVVPGAAVVARSTPSTGLHGPPQVPPPAPARRHAAAEDAVRPLHCSLPRESFGATSSGPSCSGTTTPGGGYYWRPGDEFPPSRYRFQLRRCCRWSTASAARLPRSFGSWSCLPTISCGGTGRDHRRRRLLCLLLYQTLSPASNEL